MPGFSKLAVYSPGFIPLSVWLGFLVMVVWPTRVQGAGEEGSRYPAGRKSETSPKEPGAFPSNGEVPHPKPGVESCLKSFRAPIRGRGPLRLSIEVDPSILLPFSDQFQVGIEVPVRARLEWKRMAAVNAGFGVGFHRVLDRRENVMYSGRAWYFPLVLGGEFMRDLSKRYWVRLRLKIDAGWYFFSNRVDSSTLDTLEYAGFGGHDEALMGSFGFTGGAWVEWSRKGEFFFRVGLFFRILQPVVEIDRPVHDPVSGTTQPDSAHVRMDALGIGLGGGFYFF